MLMKTRSEVGTSTADRELVEAVLKSARTQPMMKTRRRIQKEHRSFAPMCRLQKERAKVLKTSTFAEPPGKMMLRRRKEVAATIPFSGEGLEDDCRSPLQTTAVEAM